MIFFGGWGVGREKKIKEKKRKGEGEGGEDKG